MLEILVILSTLYQNFEVNIDPKEKTEHNPFITLRPSQNVKFKLVPKDGF